MTAWWLDAEHARAAWDQLDPEPAMTRAEAEADAAELGEWDPVRRVWLDQGSAAVALMLAFCIVGGLLFLAVLAGGQRAMCAMHDDGLRYCPGYEARP